MSDEFHLNSTIINNKFEKTIELLRIGNHYDTVYSTKTMKNLEVCQNLIFDVLHQRLGLPKKQTDAFLNIQYESKDDNSVKESTHKQKSRHKKSLSDTFNPCFDN